MKINKETNIYLTLRNQTRKENSRTMRKKKKMKRRKQGRQRGVVAINQSLNNEYD